MLSGLKYRMIIILALLGLNAAALGAQESGTLEALRLVYSVSADSLTAFSARRDSLSSRLERVSAEVARLKKSVAGEVFSPVDQYRLGESLRNGKTLADSLDRLNVALNALEHRTAIARAAFHRGLNRRIESLESDNNNRTAGAQAAQLAFLRRERAALSASQDKTPSRNVLIPDLAATLRVEPDDSPDQVRDKADFAADLAVRVQRGLGLVQAEIRRVRDESAVRLRTGEFAQEMALFDEGLTLRRTDTHGPAAAASSPPDKSTGDMTDGPERGHTDITPDFGLKGESLVKFQDETTSAGMLDREMYDPDRERLLLGSIESLTPGEIEALLSHLAARRDSLTRDLDTLRRLERALRTQAGQLGNEREGAGRK